jgi:hypothetical protein
MARSTAPTVEVVGLNAFNRDIKRMCADIGPLNKALSDAGRHAAEPVAAAVRSSLPHDSGRLSGTVRVTASRSGAAVREGRASVPYAGPVDFGGYPGDRPYQAGGRYLFPAATMLAGVAASRYSDGAMRAINAFAWTNTGGEPHD